MQAESRPPTEGHPGREPPSPRSPASPRTVGLAWGLLGLGVIVAFAGFIMAAFGMSQPIPVLGGFAFLSPFLAWGIGLVGAGVLLGFLGIALRELSLWWHELAPNAPAAPPPKAVELPPVRRCPKCGVHTYLTVCPECGHRFAVPSSH